MDYQKDLVAEFDREIAQDAQGAGRHSRWRRFRFQTTRQIHEPGPTVPAI